MSGKPSEFFEGDALELAEAIDQSDLDRINQFCAELKQRQTEEGQTGLDQLHKKEMTFLHFALLKKNDQAIQALCENGASPHVDLEGVGSVLYCAIKAKDPKFLKTLLEAGIDPNSTDKWEMPLFFQAVLNEDTKAIELLIEHGVDLDLTSKTGRPAILHAFNRRRYDRVEFLIDQGADLNLANNQGITMAYAIEHELGKQKANTKTAAFQKLAQLRQMMIDKGVKFPATPPSELKKVSN